MIYFWVWLISTAGIGWLTGIFCLIPAAMCTNNDRAMINWAGSFAVIVMAVWTLLCLIAVIRIMFGD